MAFSQRKKDFHTDNFSPRGLILSHSNISHRDSFLRLIAEIIFDHHISKSK